MTDGGNNNLAGRVRAARAYAGISTQKALAEAIGLSRDTLREIEAGNREPTVPELRRTAETTGVPFSFLIEGWTDSLEQRVAALEEAFRQAKKDRDRQASEIDAIYETVEKRFSDLASQRLQQDHAPNSANDRRSGADRRAP